MKATLEKAWGYQGDTLNLPVRNLAAALPFYETVLGFQVLSRSSTPHDSAALVRDGVQIGLAENGGDSSQDGCAFHVKDLEALFAELKANGLQKELSEFKIEQHDGVAWKVFYVVAPDGLCYWFGERQADRTCSEAIADELKKFQGTWRQVSWEKDGVVEPLEEQGWEPRVSFIDDTFVVTLADGSTAIQGTFRLDPTQTPKAVDWTDTFGPDAGKTFLAIYSLEGDRLVFCAADDGQERPREFRTGPGEVLRVSVREKA